MCVVWCVRIDVCVSLAVFDCRVNLPPSGEVCVGALPTWQHAVRGDFCIIDESTIVIRHFYYDSGGPGQSIVP